MLFIVGEADRSNIGSTIIYRSKASVPRTRPGHSCSLCSRALHRQGLLRDTGSCPHHCRLSSKSREEACPPQSHRQCHISGWARSSPQDLFLSADGSYITSHQICWSPGKQLLPENSWIVSERAYLFILWITKPVKWFDSRASGNTWISHWWGELECQNVCLFLELSSYIIASFFLSLLSSNVIVTFEFTRLCCIPVASFFFWSFGSM